MIYNKMLDKYVHDYLVKRGRQLTADLFAIEANVVNPTHVAIESPEGFLKEWWDFFYDTYTSRQAEHAQESNAEAAQTIDNVVSHIPSALPTPSPHSTMHSLEHNISPMVPAFPLTTPEDALMYDFRFVDMDHPSELVPFETNSSHPMELIPDMPQQWEARDEGEGHGIYTEQTTQMEPNSDAPTTAMLPMPDSSEAAIESPEGFLQDWWGEFYSMFSSNQAEHAEEPYAEAAQTMDNVVPQVPYDVPASSPDSARPAHNISPAVPAFSPERSQEQYPFDQTVQMEPNPRALKKIKLSVPEPSEAGCSIGSSSGMQHSP